MMLDRPRHKEIVEQIRAAGASLRMIGDGDIAAAIAPSLPEPDVDLYMGIGGSPEAVLAAAGIKCLGGDMQCKMWPRDEKERKKLIADGYEKDLDRVYSTDDLANGQNIIFCATGISDSALLPGVRARGGVIAVRYFWTYVEFRQCGDCLFHRQADYVCERALNLRDDLCATSLRRVSAGFVERIYFHKVIFDRCGVKPSKTHTRNVMKNRRSS